MSTKKILFYTAVAVSIAVPIVPDKYKIGVAITQPEVREYNKEIKKFDTVKTSCKLEEDFITSKGIHVCKYKCNEGGSISITSINRSKECPQTVKADVKIPKKNAI